MTNPSDQAGNTIPAPEETDPPVAANEPAPPGLKDAQEGSCPLDRPQAEEGLPRWAFELGCWTMVVLAPFLTWVNGPPVSTDQAVVRTAVFSLALAGGVVLTGVRIYGHWQRHRRR